MKTSRTVERLRQVVRVLEELPKDAGFSLNRWKCGTSACAIGWAAQDPWFIRRRFNLFGNRTPLFLALWSDGRRGTERVGGFQAVKKFFGLTQTQALDMFSPLAYPLSSGYGSKRDVIRRIKAFCNNLEAGND